MQIEALLELLKQRRSIRRFKPDPIPDGYLEKILEAGRWAMSGANAQPWEFIVVRDRQTRNKIAEAWLEPRRESYSIEQTHIEELRHPQFIRPPTAPTFTDAPVLIVVLGDRRTLQASVLSTNFLPGEGVPGAAYLKNVANATQYLHLAVAALGLGSQWVSINNMMEHSLKAILAVPAMLDIHTIVAVGYPAYEPKPAYRRELDEIVHFEQYDSRKYRSGEDVVKFVRNLRGKTESAYRPEFDRP